MTEDSLKDRFDKAFYSLLEAGDRLTYIENKLKLAKFQIENNKRKQVMVQELLDYTKENKNEYQ